MPEETYSIGFGKNDFFYSTSDKDKLDNLLLTIPFNNINTLKEWCKTKITSQTDKKKIEELSNVTNIIFNPIISDIILANIANKNDFINNYMPGNISINNNFNSIGLNMLAPTTSEKYNAPIRGNIEVTTNNKKIQKMYIDISSGISSTLDYSTQNGKLNPGITVNAETKNNNAMLEYNPVGGSVLNPDGTKQEITVSANTTNPRCKFVNNCTENHAYYASCKTIIIVDDKTNESYCKCVCTGAQLLNPDNKPHSHCNSVDINENGSNTGGLNAGWVTNYLKDTTLMGVINNIKMNLTATVMGTDGSNIDGNLVATYTNSGGLNQKDLEIRTAIYNYYAEVIKNRNLQADIMDKQTFNNTANLISQDATHNYRKQYLELFNVTTGIFLASAYIYISMK